LSREFVHASSFRSASEVGHTCRGSINLQEARIHTDESNNLIISGSSGQTFHLKAQNELDRKKWLTALEYARHRAIRTAESGACKCPVHFLPRAQPDYHEYNSPAFCWMQCATRLQTKTRT
jgi:hypothetical protein